MCDECGHVGLQPALLGGGFTSQPIHGLQLVGAQGRADCYRHGEEMLATLKTVNRLLTSDSYAVCTDPVQAGVDAACAPGISSSFKLKFSKLSYK